MGGKRVGVTCGVGSRWQCIAVCVVRGVEGSEGAEAGARLTYLAGLVLAGVDDCAVGTSFGPLAVSLE